MVHVYKSTCLLVLALLLGTAGSGIALSQTFVPVTGDPTAEDENESMSASWVDIDQDGDFDLFVANGNVSLQANALYLNDGSGTFTRTESPGLTTHTALSNGSVWADYDNDGRVRRQSNPEQLRWSQLLLQPGIAVVIHSP